MKSLWYLFVLFGILACGLLPSPPDSQSAVNSAVSQTLTAQSRVIQVPPATAQLTQPPTPTEAPSAGTKLVSEIDGMALLYVPAGVFIMGSPLGDPAIYAHEQPQHNVNLAAFWIDQTEITNRMYALCVQAGTCTPPQSAASNSRPSYYGNPAYADYPVVWVDWYQAQTYCAWAGRSLPTEAQWEKAARGTDGQQYPWGNQELQPASGPSTAADFTESCSLAHYQACEPLHDTAPVGQHPQGASPYGALDMAGNVWEWVSDWYGENYYSISPDDNPTGPAVGDAKVLRGGSFAMNFSRYLSGAHRYFIAPDQTIFGFGFRCSLDAAP